MQRSIRQSSALAAAASLALASIPFGAAKAEDTKVAQAPGTAQDLGVMAVNLKDAVKLNYGFQGALQGAGTPNEAGLGAFIPIKVSKNSVAFMDVLVNANFNDYGNYSSIVKTTVAGTTFSTSTRLGYRWLNSNRSWMYGINAGYDSRPMATGPADTGANLTFNNTVFFQQAAVNLEASSNKLNLNAYALVPFGSGSVSDGTVYVLNDYYLAGALNTFGFNAGYNLTPDLRASAGYYYQNGDLGEADGSGFLGRVDYDLIDGLTLGVSLSYDQAYETRVSGNVKYRFGGNGYRSPSKKSSQEMPVIQALTATPGNRDVRVHDSTLAELFMAKGLAFAPATSKVVSDNDIKAIKRALESARDGRYGINNYDDLIVSAGNGVRISRAGWSTANDWYFPTYTCGGGAGICGSPGGGSSGGGTSSNTVISPGNRVTGSNFHYHGSKLTTAVTAPTSPGTF